MGNGLEGETVFRFSVHPAYVTVTDGVGDAWKFMCASWRKWLPAVVVLAALEFAMYLVYVPEYSTLYHQDPVTGMTVLNADAADEAVPIVLGTLLTGVLSMVAGWIFTATAISGLRNRPMGARQIVARGLLALWATILLGFAIALAMLLVLLVAVTAPALAILLFLAVVVLAMYVYVRLVFFSLAIFDGFGPLQGLDESWRLSRGSVMRLVGWGLMAVMLSLGLGIVTGIVGAFLDSGGAQPLAQGISTTLTTALSCFTVFFMAVLYESQRARLDFSLYPLQPMPPYPGPYAFGPYPAGPYPPGPYPPGPYPPYPYPPGPYPPGAYPPAPYSGGPWAPPPYGPVPGWPPTPGVPPAWPPYPTGGPGWPGFPYPAPAGPVGSVDAPSADGPQAPAADAPPQDAATDPPASS